MTTEYFFMYITYYMIICYLDLTEKCSQNYMQNIGVFTKNLIFQKVSGFMTF